MPYAQNNDTKIYWEESGAGEPLLLIMGLGGTSKEWRRLLPALTGNTASSSLTIAAQAKSSSPKKHFQSR